MRRPFIAGNWKMNTSRAEAQALAREVALSVDHKHCDVAVCVPFPHLQTVADATRGGWFEQVTLRPEVTIGEGDAARATQLHEVAHAKCCIANSMNFPVRCEPTVIRAT